ncbi:efflux RND transporter periplasmic adaptor subunit [Moraxella nasovis]|uniref:efflux RND transporter periplasmic adaptor subunit n=1 Tax=Moraxella nasovis TaxID=2904121 RepID=UPI001F61BF38|nr:efflux RND transporter periplasmic adaptor subunit [Moraxella nasovis]UNU73134.1 efflux RND transporter periplasmic adaptor subunit [Moraxella nasovis]
MKSNLYIAIITAIMAGVALTACDKPNDAKQSVAQQMPVATVNVQTVKLQSLPVIKEFSGRVNAVAVSEVRPQVTGIIDEVLFREGSYVKKGQPLYRINTDSYKSAVISGQAAVANAQATAQNARAAYANAKANIAVQKAALDQAQADLQRLSGLVEVDAISQQAYDQAVTAVNTAQAKLQAAQATANQAAAGINSAEAAIGSAKAGLNASQLDLSRTIVRAPISGKIGISAATNGALVSANQAKALATISRTDMVYVDISQSSSELLRLRQQLSEGTASQGSLEVQIVLEDGTVYPILGQLALLDATVDESTGSVTIRAVFPNPDDILLPGMYVNARVAQAVIDNATLIPQSALIRSPKGDTQVYVVNNANKIEVRPVQVAGTYEGQWVISEGLVSKDQVVVLGGAKVKPGQDVKTAPYVSDTASQPNVAQANADAKVTQ